MLKQLKPLLIDFETTGLSPKDDYPTEVAVLKINDNDQDEFTSMIKLPNDVEIPEFITKLTGLTTDRVNRNGLSKGTVQSILKEFIDDQTLVIAHNANFDLGFLAYHFGIFPKHFMCTRSIEYLTNPHLSLSLKDVYPRYVEAKKQTHRARDDVAMTKAVFDRQREVHGDHAMEFFLNKVIRTPDRDLVFYPKNATVLLF